MNFAFKPKQKKSNKSIKDKLVNQKFTIVYDEMIKSFGLTGAFLLSVIVGRSFKYRNSNTYYYSANKKRLAGLLGVSERTILRKLNELADGGYITKKTDHKTGALYTFDIEKITQKTNGKTPVNKIDCLLRENWEKQAKTSFVNT